MFELSHKGQEILDKQLNSLLIITINHNVMPKIEPEILEKAIPSESLGCSM